MRKLHKKAMLMLAAAAIAVLSPSCDKEEAGDQEDLYFVTTNSVADYYFKPKVLNITSDEGLIFGDWFANENIGKGFDQFDQLDFDEVYAEHYFYFGDSQTRKYCDLKNGNTGKEILVDPSDTISPFKEYADYFGDTLYICGHRGAVGIGDHNFCVLPVKGVDVTCDKDFDSDHPAGSNLNDIMCWLSFEDYDDCFHQTDENGNLVVKDADSKIVNTYYHIPLNSIPKNPLLLTINKFYLEFNSQPAEPGTYEFTVKFTFGPDPLSGEIVDVPSAKVSMVF